MCFQLALLIAISTLAKGSKDQRSERSEIQRGVPLVGEVCWKDVDCVPETGGKRHEEGKKEKRREMRINGN